MCPAVPAPVLLEPWTVPVRPVESEPPGERAPDPLDVLGVPGQINLDYAASAPCARAAADAVAELLPWYASVHQSAGALSQRCTSAYERARQTVADFIGARPDDHVIFTRSTTDALNLLASVLPDGTTVVTFAGEHHANLLPWPGSTVRLPVPGSPQAAVRGVSDALQELRRIGGPGDAPILVAVTGASNVTGELWPIADLAVAARRHGARIAVDAAQLAPHAPVDIAALDVDYVAFSGHKLYAPFGAGVLAGRSDWLDAAPPYLAGGGATTHVGAATHDVRWARGPVRHEAGTPNLLGAVALAAVCEALDRADRAVLQKREQALLTRLRTGLAALPTVQELRIFDDDSARVGIVSFAVPGVDSAAVTVRLAREHGVGLRDGLFSAHPLARRLLAEAAGRSGRRDLPETAIRASFGLGSAPEHIDRLLHGLRGILADGDPEAG